VPRRTEADLIDAFRQFVVSKGLVSEAHCHFSGDSDDCADVELTLEAAGWPKNFPRHLLIEAKSHHSTDAPNTINKIFGQLMKETGKHCATRVRRARSYKLAVLVPADSAHWTGSNGKRHRQPGGLVYYQSGFRRIDRRVYIEFGALVEVAYVLLYSISDASLAVYDWVDFYDQKRPLVEYGA